MSIFGLICAWIILLFSFEMGIGNFLITFAPIFILLIASSIYVIFKKK